MFALPDEAVELSGAAALWKEALSKQDLVTAAQLMKENAPEIAGALGADPELWSRWKHIATRALVPTAAPATTLFDVVRLLLKAERELLYFGGADPTVMALRKRVKKLVDASIPVFEDAYKELHRRMDFLGLDTAEAVFPDFEVQPELLV